MRRFEPDSVMDFDGREVEVMSEKRFIGILTGVRVFDKCLSPAEVKAVFEKEKEQ